VPLTIGLDKKSPVPLEGNPRRYEGLIDRHGQWVRWSIARKCTCLLATNRPDPRCPLCRGSGWRYFFQDKEEETEIAARAVSYDTVELPYATDKGSVISLRTASGKTPIATGIFGQWVKVSGVSLDRGSTVYAAVMKARVKKVPSGSAFYAGHNIVKLDEYEFENPWARVPYDLVRVKSLTRSDGSPLAIEAWSVDKVIIEDAGALEVGERLTIDAEYMPPYRIAVLNQNLSVMDQNFLRDVGGDAMAVFPFAYKISEYDTVTLWAGTQVRKKIIRKSIDETDILPDLFVSGVLNLTDAEREYVEGVDYALWDRNTIRWLGADMPDNGKYFSIEYMANVTYRVLPQLPNIRSSEDKRFPSRVALKLESGTTGSDQV